MKLYDPEKANNYKVNRAIFNPTDDLVLNDGVLWDIRQPKAIHKFDKFNQYVSGVFHPVGLEIIINSEIVSFIVVYMYCMLVLKIYEVNNNKWLVT